MVARRQLIQHGVDWDHVHAQVLARRWVERTPRVISAFTGELTWEQRQWLAVLHAGPRSACWGASRRQDDTGWSGWTRPNVSVYVDDELSFEPVDGVQLLPEPSAVRSPARPAPGRSALPARAVDPAVRWLRGGAAGSARRRSPRRSSSGSRPWNAWSSGSTQLRPLRRSKPFKQTLGDIAGGAHSGAELDVRRMCRRFGMPHARRSTTPDRPRRQASMDRLRVAAGLTASRSSSRSTASFHVDVDASR